MLEGYVFVTFAGNEMDDKGKKLEKFPPTGSCPVRDVLSRLGDKWSMLVLLTLT